MKKSLKVNYRYGREDWAPDVRRGCWGRSCYSPADHWSWYLCYRDHTQTVSTVGCVVPQWALRGSQGVQEVCGGPVGVCGGPVGVLWGLWGSVGVLWGIFGGSGGLRSSQEVSGALRSSQESQEVSGGLGGFESYLNCRSHSIRLEKWPS